MIRMQWLIWRRLKWSLREYNEFWYLTRRWKVSMNDPHDGVVMRREKVKIKRLPNFFWSFQFFLSPTMDPRIQQHYRPPPPPSYPQDPRRYLPSDPRIRPSDPRFASTSTPTPPPPEPKATNGIHEDKVRPRPLFCVVCASNNVCLLPSIYTLLFILHAEEL